MQEVTVIFPHQLFKTHPAVIKERTIFLVEEWLYFKQYHFHQQKLILHRATMQFFQNYLIENEDIAKLYEKLKLNLWKMLRYQ